MTKITRLTNQHLQHRKRASAPKVPTWQTWLQHNPLLNIGLLGGLVILGIAYISLVNGNAATAFQLNKLNNQVVAMQDQNQALQLNMAEALSLPRISLVSQDQKLVPTTEVTYLTNSNTAVAISGQ